MSGSLIWQKGGDKACPLWDVKRWPRQFFD